MQRTYFAAAGLALALSATGCTKMFVNATVPTIQKLSALGFAKTDLDFMGAALPPSLLQLEGFLTIVPENEALLVMVAESKCGYALGWIEDNDPELASKYYLEGRDLALKALYLQSKGYRKAIDAGEPVHKAVQRVDDPDLVPTLFTAGNCWASWLQLNLTSSKALFAQPSIVALMQRVLDIDPNYYHGGAYLFFGSYYSSIPAIAGGGLAKGHEYFQKAFAASNNNFLLVHYYYAKTYATLLKDLEDPASGKPGAVLFDEAIAHIENTPADAIPELGLANAIAKEKARALKARRSEFF